MHILDKAMHYLILASYAAEAGMLDNFHLSLISGGQHLCTPAWTRVSGSLDRCFKCYLPVSGTASVVLKGETARLAPGRLYFIPGYHLVRQECLRSMNVHWLHFVPDSYFLHRILLRVASIHSWPLSLHGWIAPSFRRVKELFDEPERTENHPRIDAPPALVCRIEGILMFLTADLLENVVSITEKDLHFDTLARLKPAIDFMDSEFANNPGLAEAAAHAGLSPNYFHRLFHRTTGMTPFHYMETRRLDTARGILAEGRLNVKEVAAASGYENPFYFSRAFRKRFGVPPSAIRGAGISIGP